MANPRRDFKKDYAHLREAYLAGREINPRQIERLRESHAARVREYEAGQRWDAEHPEESARYGFKVAERPPPWDEIEAEFGIDPATEPVQPEPEPARTRGVWELSPAEKRKLTRLVRKNAATGKPPQREIARELGVSRQKVSELVKERKPR